MTILLLTGVMLLAGFVAVVLIVRIEVQHAESTGTLRDFGPGRWLRKPISRDSQPEVFADGLRWLRAVPWITAATFSFGMLLMSLLL